MSIDQSPKRRRRRRDELSEACTFEGCGRPRYSNNLCRAHDSQRQRGGPLRPVKVFHTICVFAGCGRPHSAHGLCGQHDRQRKAGKQLTPLKRKVRGGGDWFITTQGYRSRHVRLNGQSARQYEHREVMIQMLGRPLRPGENVHHLNGDRTDNRLENLELWITQQPTGQRLADKIAWAKDLLATYEPAALRSSE